jgi:heparan-alpha-glucosaminide N-acetyltransferase
MIFANDGGAGYYFFEHATWDGLYVADLVFPWYLSDNIITFFKGFSKCFLKRFLWIMGVCIPVSIKSQVKRGNSRWTIWKRILIRSCKLILLGIILGSLWGPVDINSMRLPGVLQRFGICYFLCSTLVLFCMTVDITKPEAVSSVCFSSFFFLSGDVEQMKEILFGGIRFFSE